MCLNGDRGTLGFVNASQLDVLLVAPALVTLKWLKTIPAIYNTRVPSFDDRLP